jgi:hypothetical protein
MNHTKTNYTSQSSYDDHPKAVPNYADADSGGRIPGQSEDPSNEPTSSLEDPLRIDSSQRKEILYQGTKLDMPLWLAQHLLLQ